MKHLSLKNYICISIFIIIVFNACEEPGNDEEAKPYNGPMVSMEDFSILYTDSGIVRLKVEAPRQMEYANGNQIYPKGFKITFFDEIGKKASFIRADSGRYNADEKRYTGYGNVVVKNLQKKERLNSEILHWEPQAEKIHTDTFVSIISDEETLTGKGLTAKEDFSDYEIINPSGTMTLEDSLR